MRLNERQKKQLLEWVAEGLPSDEINRRAAQFEQPFQVSREQARWYRRTRGVRLTEIRAATEDDALSSGLSIKSERVRKLKQLAALLEEDLFGTNLWTTDVKAVGTEKVFIERFNAAEVREYRGLLDDIAQEIGERIQKVEASAPGGRALIPVAEIVAALKQAAEAEARDETQ